MTFFVIKSFVPTILLLNAVPLPAAGYREEKPILFLFFLPLPSKPYRVDINI